FLFVCGLSAVDARSGERVRGTTASETRQILINLKQLLEAAGSSLDKVVKVNVLLHSMLEAPNMNEVYASFFPDPPPARTVWGARLPDGAKVTIECTALACPNDREAATLGGRAEESSTQRLASRQPAARSRHSRRRLHIPIGYDSDRSADRRAQSWPDCRADPNDPFQHATYAGVRRLVA